MYIRLIAKLQGDPKTVALSCRVPYVCSLKDQFTTWHSIRQATSWLALHTRINLCNDSCSIFSPVSLVTSWSISASRYTCWCGFIWQYQSYRMSFVATVLNICAQILVFLKYLTSFWFMYCQVQLFCKSSVLHHLNLKLFTSL